MNDKTMNDFGVRVGKDAIRFVRTVPGPIEKVWAYLTEPEKRALWLAGGKTATETGGEAIFEFDHSRISPHEEAIPEKYRTPDGTPEFDLRFVGEVLLYIPPRRLKVTWPDSNNTDSTLDITLTEKKGMIELVLFHEKMPSEDFMRDVLAGWHVHLDILQDRLEGREPGPFWQNHTLMEVEYEKSKIMS